MGNYGGGYMKYNSKGMTCGEFIQLMRDRGLSYDNELGGLIKKNGKPKGKTSRNGYRTIALNKDHVEYTFCEHRCVWVWFKGDIPDGMEINHIDANRGNNHIDNLELVNHSQNMRHAVKIGNLNARKAEASGKAVYTNEEVIAMRTLKKNGWSTEKIANAFNAKWPQTIQRLIRGGRYGSISGNMKLEQAQKIAEKRSAV